MGNSLLVQLLRTLNNRELEHFVAYVQAPFVKIKGKSDCIRLLAVLAKAAPDYLEKKTKAELVFKQVFPDNIYNKKKTRLRSVSSNLKTLLEEFLVFREITSGNSEFQYNQLLLSTLKKRKLVGLIEKTFNKVERDYKEKKEKKENQDIYYYCYLLEDLKVELIKNKQIQASKNQQVNYEIVLEQFDVYVLLSRLKYYCAILNDRRVGNTVAYDEIALDILLETIKNGKWAIKYPVINSWHKLLLFIKTESDESFMYLKDILYASEERMEDADLQFYYDLLLNYTARKIRSGDLSYMETNYELQKKMFDKGLLLRNGLIRAYHIKNRVSIGLQMGKFEETEKFIEAYRDKVNLNERELVYHFNRAAFHFYKGNYEIALEELALVSLNDAPYYLDIYGLYIKIYYKNNEDIPFNNKINAYRSYINKNEAIKEEVKKLYYEFIKLIKRLHKLRYDLKYSSKKGREDVVKLKEDIKRTNTSNKVWLLAEVEVLLEEY